MTTRVIRAGTSAYIGKSARDLADLVADAKTDELGAIANEELLELYCAGEWWRRTIHCSGFRETFKRISQGTIREYVVSDAGQNAEDPTIRDYLVLHERGFCIFSSERDNFVLSCAMNFTRYLNSGAPSLGRLSVEGPWGCTRDQVAYACEILPISIRANLREIRDARKITVEGATGLWDVEISRSGIIVSKHVPDRSEMLLVHGVESREGELVGSVMSLLLVEDFIGDNDLESRITNLRRPEGLIPASEPRRIVDGWVLVASMTGCGEAARVLRPPP